MQKSFHMKICTKCRIEQHIDNFTFKNKAKGFRKSICRKCWAAYHNLWYKKNSKLHIARVAATQAAVETHIKEAKSAPCVDCKMQYPYYVMDFDHVRGKNYLIYQKADELDLTKSKKKLLNATAYVPTAIE